MISPAKRYPAKLLLFGEYGILLGSNALLIPYPKYSGHLLFQDSKINETFVSLLKYLKREQHKFSLNIDLSALESDVFKGLQFESTIPYNYGLGSSGALVAAVYENYSTIFPESNGINLSSLRKDLALLESYFHGKSSGVDPLVSLIQKSLFIDEHSAVNIMHDFRLPANNKSGFFLLDSKQPGKTGNLVSRFMRKLEDKRFLKLFLTAYSEFSNKAIERLLADDMNSFSENLSQLSEFQLNNMSELLPMDMQANFKEGLNSGNFFLKICGSGGGGYFLGFSNDINSIKNIFEHAVLI